MAAGAIKRFSQNDKYKRRQPGAKNNYAYSCCYLCSFWRMVIIRQRYVFKTFSRLIFRLWRFTFSLCITRLKDWNEGHKGDWYDFRLCGYGFNIWRFDLNHWRLAPNLRRLYMNRRRFDFDRGRLDMNRYRLDFDGGRLDMNRHRLYFGGGRLDFNLRRLDLNRYRLDFDGGRLDLNRCRF
jgi:hypothetical protein